MAASSGVRCATFFDAASTFLSNDATVAEESAARPRLLPARERKSRRVRTCASTNQSDFGGSVQSLSSRAEATKGSRKKDELGTRAGALMFDVRGLMFDVDAEGRGGVIRRATGKVRFDE